MLLAVLPAAAACHFSVSAGGPDYGKLESAIADNLNKQYSSLSQQVSGVECPRAAQSPKSGDTITCVADLDGHDVRVGVRFTDDDYNADYSTLDVVYNLTETEKALSQKISQQYGFPVSVRCGTGIKVVAVGDRFECEAADRRGAARTVQVTAVGPIGPTNGKWSNPG